MPLAKAKSKKKKAVQKTASSNIREMYTHPGPRMKALEKKYGKDSEKMREIRAAAGFRAAKGSGKKKGRSPRKRR